MKKVSIFIRKKGNSFSEDFIFDEWHSMPQKIKVFLQKTITTTIHPNEIEHG